VNQIKRLQRLCLALIVCVTYKKSMSFDDLCSEFTNKKVIFSGIVLEKVEIHVFSADRAS